MAGKSIIQMLPWKHQMTVGGLQLSSLILVQTDRRSTAITIHRVPPKKGDSRNLEYLVQL